MKKVLKVILIILGAFMFALMIVKCAGEKTVIPIHNLPLNHEMFKPVNNAVNINNDYTIYQANATFSLPTNLIVDQKIVYWSNNEYISMRTATSGYELYYTDGTNIYSLGVYSYSNYQFTITYPTGVAYSYYLFGYDSSVTSPVKPLYSTTDTLYNLVFGGTGNKIDTNSTLILTNDGTYQQGYDYGYTTGLDVGARSTYENAYNVGYDDAIDDVYNNPSNYGYYTSSQYDSLKQAYDTLYAQADQDFTQSAFKNLLNQVIGTPYNAFKGMFNFEFFGVNLFDLFSFLFTCALVGFLIKKII